MQYLGAVGRKKTQEILAGKRSRIYGAVGKEQEVGCRRYGPGVYK